MKIFIFIIISYLVARAGAVNGADYSTLVPTAKIQCLVQNGYTFAIPRGYRSNGTLDPNIR